MNGVEDGSTVSFNSLLESGATTKAKNSIHKVVVGREDFTAKGVTIQAHAFTKAAPAMPSKELTESASC